jgi:putative transposase
MSSLVECTALGNTVTKSKKIRIYPNSFQKELLKQCLGVSRFVYNKTVDYLKQEGTKANWKEIKTGILHDLPEFCSDIPYQIKSIAIRDACIAVRDAKKRYLTTGAFNQVSFKSRKDPKQSFYIPKSAVKEDGFYKTIFGEMLYKEQLPKEIKDCRLSYYLGRWYLCAPFESKLIISENQGRLVSLDPGVRTFQTFFSENSCGKLGNGDFGRIQRLCHYLDKLLSKKDKAKSKRKNSIKKAVNRLRNKIRDLVDEMHRKVAYFLVKNFDVILLPTFESKEMSNKLTRRIRKKTVRSLLTWSHFRFKQFLKSKAYEYGKIVLDVNEAYTSKTVSWTGEIVNNLGGKKEIKSKITGDVMDRDYNGARGIFLRALVDSPALSSAIVSNC